MIVTAICRRPWATAEYVPYIASASALKGEQARLLQIPESLHVTFTGLRSRRMQSEKPSSFSVQLSLVRDP